MNGIKGTKRLRVIFAVAMAVMILITLTPLTANAEAGPGKIIVSQIFNNSYPEADGTFTYRLESLVTGAPMPEGSLAGVYTFTITGTRSEELVLPAYNYQRYFVYNLYQVIGAEKPGYTYDRRVYRIEVQINAGLDMSIVAVGEDGKKVESITFENSFGLLPSDPSLMVDPPVVKTVFGNPGRSSIFTFRLEAHDASNPMPPGSVNGVKTLSITGSGSGEFGVWSYVSAGTYYYSISEVNTGESGYTYDTAVYTITDMVRAENGQLVLNRVVTNNTNRQVTSCIYNNYYSGGNPYYPPSTPVTPTPAPVTPGPGVVVTDPPVTPTPEDEPDLTDLDDTDVPYARIEPDDTPAYGVPKTGDDSKADLFIALFVSGGIVAAGAVLYLAALGKRGRRCHHS